MATLEQKLDLSSQQKELVAVGASGGAGCHPCVSHHLQTGAKAGLDGEQLLAATTSAERVSAEAAVRMGDHVRGTLGPNVTPALLSRVEEVLASLGAALGANDKTNIESQLKAAAELGVSPKQLREAIETARIVQENATRIHMREAERLLDTLEVVESTATADEGCGCGAADTPAATPAETPPVPEGIGGCGKANNDHAAGSEEPPAAKPVAETSAGCGPAAGERGSGGFAAMMAAFCAPSGQSDGMTGPAAAMEKCRGMLEPGSEPAPAATSVETPTAPESAGSCGEGC